MTKGLYHEVGGQSRLVCFLCGHVSCMVAMRARTKNCHQLTLPATNIAPENGCLEYKFPFGMAGAMLQ